MPIIEPIATSDASEFLHINNLAVPHVNELDTQQFSELLAQTRWSMKIASKNELQAILLVLVKGERYQSLNYRWFSDRYDNFAYVDRIVVAESARGEGYARVLYEALFEVALDAGLSRVCCEVNLMPANPGSMAFHEKLGFQSVGEQHTDEGRKKVNLLIKELNGISLE